MSRCRRCNVEVLDETERCPLCNSVLEYTFEVENMYPNVRVQSRKWMLWSRIYLLTAIIAEVLLLCINYVGDYKTWWSLIVGLVFCYGYMVIRFALLGKAGHKEKIVVLSAISILIMVASDFLVGYAGWSVNYGLPSIVILLDFGIILLMIKNRKTWQSYIMWQILMVLVSIVLVVLYFFEIITVPHVMGVAVLFSAFLFLGTLIIGDRRARVELQRRFHI